MIIYAYIGWIDNGEPHIYCTCDIKEAQQGLMRVRMETRAKTNVGRALAEDRAREMLLAKWCRQ